MDSAVSDSSPLSSPVDLDDDDAPSASPPYIEQSEPQKETKHRAPKRRADEKLDDVLTLFDGFRWTLKDFLEQLRDSTTIESRPESKITKKRRQSAWATFKRFAYCDMPSRGQARQLLKAEEQMGLASWCTELTSETLRREVLSLAQNTTFGAYGDSTSDVNARVERVFIDSPQAIVDSAPTWLHLFNVASQSTQSHKLLETTLEMSRQIAKDSILVFAYLCRKLQNRRSDMMASLIGIYLYEGGAKTRVIDTLAQLGVCLSSKSILNRVHLLESEAEDNVRRLGLNPTSVITWDNFEFREGRRGERVGDEAEFRSITTALVTGNRYPELSSLSADIWKPLQNPLSAKSIFINVKGDGVPLEFSMFFIEKCVEDLVTRKHDIWVTSPPTIRRLPPNKTNALPLKPILRDESSTENNIYIIEDIFRRQMRMDPSDAEFKNKLRVLSGDLKTWSRIQSAKSYRQETAGGSFDSLQWATPILGLWHLRYNMLQLIHRIHWGGPENDSSTLQYAADRWHRSSVLDGKKFGPTEDLILHSYRSRVVGLLLLRMKQMRADNATLEDLDRWLALQSKDSWRATLSSIANSLRSSRDHAEGFHNDQIYQNHQMFCRHVEVYLLLKYAIKMADIGLLRVALRHATIIFLPSEAGTPKYAAALLYSLHLVDSPASSEQFQNYVLANSLVNLSGREDSNFEHDRLLELHNNALKTYLRERTIFSSHNDELLRRWALIGPIVKDIKDTIQFFVNYSRDGSHPPKTSREDVWSMASNLAITSLRKQQKDRYSLYPAVDLIRLGMNKLGDAVFKYNESLGAPLSGLNAKETATGEEDKPNEPIPTEDLTETAASPTFDSAIFDPQVDWLGLSEMAS